MHLLISNDDGILAPGLMALATAMCDFGEVTVIAPEENQSTNGHRKTLTKPLRINSAHLLGGAIPGITTYSSDGSPADCVALALLGFLQKPVDLVVSGINRGPNLGQDLTYSGTIAAAFEGTIHGKASIAFSLDNRAADLLEHYAAAAQIAHRVVAQVLDHGLRPLTLLNVNIPNLDTDKIVGVQVTRQGTSMYHDELVSLVDPYGRPYYWIGGEAPTGDVTAEGTDIRGVHEGYVSITPIHLDMTVHSMIPDLRDWSF